MMEGFAVDGLAGALVDDTQVSQRLLSRARMHAALGEPLRLAIVDNLVRGDASPGELGETVSLPTNLLAHHLKVLDEAGLIRRVRSEGDRRRSYVQLRWDDVAVAALLGTTSVPQVGKVTRVVFVCTHNSARSQLAAAAWARVSDIPAASAGTHPAARVHPRAVAAARRHGLRLAVTDTRHVADVLQPDDLVVAVCDNAHEELVAAATPDHRSAAPGRREWLHWAVPDPVGLDTDAAFEGAFTDLTNRVRRLAHTLRPTDDLS
jgi:ArsR family transcriptional regulator, arsenate/arsenite/antimonite-responsive transcriptional repressor / arsenate reductase (thioredoxin)